MLSIDSRFLLKNLANKRNHLSSHNLQCAPAPKPGGIRNFEAVILIRKVRLCQSDRLTDKILYIVDCVNTIFSAHYLFMNKYKIFKHVNC